MNIQSVEELKRLYWDEKLSLREIANICGCCKQTILNWMRKHGIPTRDKLQSEKIAYLKSERTREALKRWYCEHTIRPDLFPSPALSYILGVLLGDGSVSIRGNNYQVCLLVNDKEFAEKFAECLKRIGLHPNIWIDKNGRNIVKASSKIFVEWFRRLSYDEIESIIEGYEDAFVRGFYDSEGTLNKQRWKEYVAVFNTNEEIIRLVHRILQKLGFDNKIHWRRSGVYAIQICGRLRVERFLSIVKPTIPRKGILTRVL